MTPMTAIEFFKGHGTGNDFVLLPDLDGKLDLEPSVVAALCDRRFGLGGDGLLRVVRSAAHPETAGLRDAPEFFMDYRNADGSVAEMCGNGVRVFVRYLVEAGLADGSVTLLTRAGPVSATVTDQQVAARLRRPRLTGEGTARLAGREFSGVQVDCGNPHLVCPLSADVELAALDLTHMPAVDPAQFPDGTNVEFLAPLAADHVRMRVYERGVGETLSCGSGACAAAAVTLAQRGTDTGTVTVDVPGGRLTVEITDDAATLAGPAVLIAHGTVDLSRVRQR